MSLQSKLDLKSLTDAEVPDLAALIVTSMTGNVTFPAPAPGLATLTAQAQAMSGRIAARDALLQQAQSCSAWLGVCGRLRIRSKAAGDVRGDTLVQTSRLKVGLAQVANNLPVLPPPPFRPPCTGRASLRRR